MIYFDSVFSQSNSDVKPETEKSNERKNSKSENNSLLSRENSVVKEKVFIKLEIYNCTMESPETMLNLKCSGSLKQLV